MANEIPALKAKRAGLKQRITKFNTHLDGLMHTDLTPDSIFNLETRITKFNSVYDNLQEIQTSLLSKIDGEIVAQVEEAEGDVIENQFFAAMARAKSLISELRTNVNQANITLPKIHLPKFAGNFEKWIEFRDTYLS